MSSDLLVHTNPPGATRRAVSRLALVVLVGAIIWLMAKYITNPDIRRPHDLLQVWAAGRLALTGGNPWDAEQMYRLQIANRPPADYAAMMWVPPWGLVVAAPIGALPIDLAQGVWVFGQVALVLASAALLWRVYGGRPDRWWVGVAIAAGFGPLWWQTMVGQYAGLLLAGMTGFLVAHRAGRPVLAGLCLTLVALKPHLFVPLAVGLLIDGRTPFGRRVLFGGAVGLLTAALFATALHPAAWGEYLAATGRAGSTYAPSLSDWFNPTIPAWLRHYTPGRPFWVQCVPAAVGAVGFAVYWWRRGDPARWPGVLPWVLPLALLIPPYGCWPSDLTLLLIPFIALAVKFDAAAWAVPRRRALALVYVAANLVVVGMIVTSVGHEQYIWVTLALIGCLVLGWWGVTRGPEPARSVATGA